MLFVQGMFIMQKNVSVFLLELSFKITLKMADTILFVKSRVYSLLVNFLKVFKTLFIKLLIKCIT